MQTCGVPCPDLSVTCGSRPHEPGVAHHANGTAPDGTHWSLFWWRPDEGAGPPVPPVPTVPEGGAGSPGGTPGRPPA
jgi:hypothetical protein